MSKENRIMRTAKRQITGFLTAVLCVVSAARANAEVFEANGRGGSPRNKTEARDRALGDALAKILEEYEEYSKGREQLWVKALVQAHPRHVVKRKHYEIVQEMDAAGNVVEGLYKCELRVRLPREALDEAWAEARAFFNNVLQGTMPTVAIFEFVDRIEENHPGPYWRYTERNSDSWVAQQLEELLLEKGFRVVSNPHAERLRRIKIEKAEIGQHDLEVLREIATQQSADMFIVGYAHVIGPECDDRVTPGKKTWFWDASAKTKLFWTDTGECLSTLDTSTEKGQSNRAAGRIHALRNVGQKLAPMVLDQIAREWSVCAFEGRPMTVEVLGCDALQAMEIKAALQEILRDEAVRNQPAGQTAKFTFKCKGPTDELAAVLATRPYNGFRLEFKAARFNTIELEVRN